MIKPSSYPYLAQCEYFLSRSRLIGLGIEFFFHRPRRWLYSYCLKRRKLSESLTRYESKNFSQTGEDGIIQEIFRRIGTENNFVVEFGVQDGTECCSRNLFVNYNWKGLLIEGSPQDALKAETLYANLSNVSVSCNFITKDNILGILASHNVPRCLDLLIVDIDGNDYWVLMEILTLYAPRVIVVEYNAKWVPPTQWVMPYNEQHCWDGSAYFGASLTSLTQLAESYDYSLVGCNLHGNNAFFVGNAMIGNSFPDSSAGASYHYSPPMYTKGFGFPFRSRFEPYAKRIVG